MGKPAKIANDFGVVELDEALIESIGIIQEAAETMQMTPAEFIQIFDQGIPYCPCCQGEDKPH